MKSDVFLVRCFALSLIACLGGIGVGCALWGYSYVIDSRTSVDKLSDAMAAALEKVTFKVSNVHGTVQLDTTGATVRLEIPQFTLGQNQSWSPQAMPPSGRSGGGPLGAGSRGLLAGPGSAGGGSLGAGSWDLLAGPRSAGGSTEYGSASSSDPDASKIVIDYTRFSNVRWDGGIVTTGWKYRSRTEETPYEQYCYFRADGADQIYDLGLNGIIAPATPDPPGVDLNAAARNCVWYKGLTPAVRRRT
jgi:hypothetical protein